MKNPSTATTESKSDNLDPNKFCDAVPAGIGNPITAFRAGLQAPLYGLQLFAWGMSKRSLLPYLLLPIAIQTTVVSLLLLVLYFLFGYVRQLVDYLVAKGVATLGPERLGFDDDVTIETINYFSHLGLWLLLIVFFLYIFFVVWRLTGGLVNGYLSGKLCDIIITKLGWNSGTGQTTMLGEVGTSVLMATAFTAIQPLLGFTVFIPFIGPIISLLISAFFAAFLSGVNELRDPLRSMGLSDARILWLCFRYTPMTLGVGYSFLLTEPIPFLGGVVQTAESLGRIAVARRLMEQEGLLDTESEPHHLPTV